MKVSAKQIVVLVLVLASVGAIGVLAQSSTALPGATDPPMINRFAGSIIVNQLIRDYDAYRLPLGLPTELPSGTMEDKFKSHLDVEGKVTRTMYLAPPKSSPLLVYRSYQDALKRAGFVTMFTCELSPCRWLTNAYAGHWDMGGNGLGDDAHVLVAQLSRPTGAVFVSLCTAPIYSDAGRVYIFVDVIETKPMASGLVPANAAELANDISRNGHASVYGIYFDTGKSDLRPESDATLTEISKLLTSDPALKLHVVGHTDNAGGLAPNMTLSAQRADAVIAALIQKYHVATARLDAAGLGPLSPVATNQTDDGRAKNRRVELVEQ